MIRLLKRLDFAVYVAERAVVAASLGVMSVVVFADVIHRLFADPESKLARWLVGLLRLFGAQDDGTGPLYETMRDWVAPPLLFAFFVGLCFFAVKSARRDAAIANLRAGLVAVGMVFAAWVVVRLFIWLVPNGVVWAQTLALVLTLWVGFLGASMCTYEGRHLRVEVADRIWPDSLRPYVGGVALVFTALFVFFLFGLAVLFIEFQLEEYVQTEGQGGTFEGLRVLPRWIAFLVLPISFLVMGLRFTAAAVATFMRKTYGLGGGDPVAAMLKEAARGGEEPAGAADAEGPAGPASDAEDPADPASDAEEDA